MMSEEVNKTAFVLGYSGETGKALVSELSRDERFTRVVLIGRRRVYLPEDTSSDFEQNIVDFENIEDYADVFAGCDVGFCCLGTTVGKSGKENFVNVDRDFVVNSAQLAKSAGCKHFQVMSAYGANKHSSMLYNRTKGEMEDGLKDLDFPALSIFRPAFLLCDRVESRPMEKIFHIIGMPFFKIFPTVISVPVETVAKAMVKAVFSNRETKVEVIENKNIHALAREYKTHEMAVK